MQVAGFDFSAASQVYPILREGRPTFVFEICPITDLGAFDLMWPAPKPPMRELPSGAKIAQKNDPDYVAQVEERNVGFVDFLFLFGIRHMDKVKWSTVDYDDPSTFKNWRGEALDAGITELEIIGLIKAATAANFVDPDKIEEAKARFLAMREEGHNQSNSQADEQDFTESTGLANV